MPAVEDASAWQRLTQKSSGRRVRCLTGCRRHYPAVRCLADLKQRSGQLQRQLDNLKRQLSIDPLTGVLNR